MRKAKLIVILLVLSSFVSVSALENPLKGIGEKIPNLASGFSVDFEGFGAVIVLVGFIIMLGFIGKHVAHNRQERAHRHDSRYGGAGMGRDWRKEREWKRSKAALRGTGRAFGFLWRNKGTPYRLAKEWKKVRKDRKKEARQLEADEEIDKRVRQLEELERRIHLEEGNLDEKLYSMDVYERKLEYWQGQILPYLNEVMKRIRGVKEAVEKDEKNLLNPDAVRERLQNLQVQFENVRWKHDQIMERLEKLNRSMVALVEEKKKRAGKERGFLDQETGQEIREIHNLSREVRESINELLELKKANASDRDKEMAAERFRGLQQRRKELIEEYKEREKEMARGEKAKEKGGELLRILGEQERLIRAAEGLGQAVSSPLLTGVYTRGYETELQRNKDKIRENSKRILQLINELKEIDAINQEMGRRFEELEGRRAQLEKEEMSELREEKKR